MVYVAIKDLGEVVTGKTPPTENQSFFDGEIPFITPSDIDTFDKKYLFSTERTLSPLGAKKIKNCKIPPKSICFVCIGSTIGKMCMTNCESYTNQQINSVIPNEKWDNDYLFYLLRYIKVHFQSIGAGTGSGKGIVNKTIFSKAKVQVIETKDIQRRIGAILSTYDTLIENNNKRIKLLEQMAESLYKEWFVRRKGCGWNLVKMNDFGYSLESGSRPKGGIDASLIDGIPSLGAEAIGKLGEFDYSSIKYVPAEFYKKMKRGHVCDNDILLYKDGAYIGKVTLFMDEFPFKEYSINEYVFIVRSNNPIYQYYLYFTLKLPQYFTQMQNLNRNAAQPGLTGKDIDLLKLYLPDEVTIAKFNAAVEPMLHRIFILAKSNQNFTKQRDMLLPRLMSGKLEV